MNKGESSGVAVMCRPLFHGFFWVILLGPLTPCLAQPSLPEDYLDLAGADIKELAKAAFESSQAAPRDLARARVEAAQTRLRERYKKYRDGAQDVTLDLLLAAVAPIADAELAALEKPAPADRQAALAARWLFALSAEQMVEAKYRVGRVSLADLMQARYARLDAEIRLREADAGKKLSDPFLPSLPLGLEEPLFDFYMEAAAKHAFEAGQADLRDLARARRDAARIESHVRHEKYLAGNQDVTLDLKLESAARRAKAELAALDNPTPADRLAVLAVVHWRSVLFADWLEEARYHVGRISLAGFAQAQHARLDAEIKLREANAGHKLANPFLVPALPLDLEAFLDPCGQRLAKSIFEAGRADLGDLTRARRDVIRTCFQWSYQMYRAGAQNVWLGLLLEPSRLLLEAELAIFDDPAERLAAHERYWGALRIVEEIVRAKYAAGRVGLADYAQTQYDRLDAEIRMREAQKKLKEK
jgi:hypothetical protein